MQIMHLNMVFPFFSAVLISTPGRAFSLSFTRGINLRSRAASTLGTSIQQTHPNHISLPQTATRSLATRSIKTTLSAKVGTPPTAFDDGKSPFQITTPIYYVNDKPHIGHAYTSLACDVLARFMRLSGREVFFVSGTDEHGQKVEDSAAAKGVPPQQFVDEVSVSFRELLDLLHISNDMFIRTTDDDHKKSVQHFWKTLVEKDAIYLGAYEGWYSVRDECYYNESELVDGKAPTGADVEWVTKEPSYFFKLSEFEDKLLEYYDQNPDFIAPESRRNEVLSFVKGGLKDLSVSRTSFKWGVPVPGDDDHVMYVWIDALANYISALGYPNADAESQFSKYWPASVHVVGKDILRFHAIYWPALLMAADLPVPKRLFAHGWWTKEGEKISKSLGNIIDPVELIGKVSFGGDGDFSDDRMIQKINTNLANELGNLCQRVLTLVFKNCDKAVPIEIGSYTEDDDAILNSARTLKERCGIEISKQAIHRYSYEMVAMVTEANVYIDRQAPWVLKKTDLKRMGTVLYVLMEVLRHVAILYQPLIPSSANKILDMLAVPDDERTFDHLESCEIKLGAPVCKPSALFPRIEAPETVDA